MQKNIWNVWENNCIFFRCYNIEIITKHVVHWKWCFNSFFCRSGLSESTFCKSRVSIKIFIRTLGINPFVLHACDVSLYNKMRLIHETDYREFEDEPILYGITNIRHMIEIVRNSVEPKCLGIRFIIYILISSKIPMFVLSVYLFLTMTLKLIRF